MPFVPPPPPGRRSARSVLRRLGGGSQWRKNESQRGFLSCLGKGPIHAGDCRLNGRSAATVTDHGDTKRRVIEPAAAANAECGIAIRS